jgi:hypothetical protein
MTSRSKDPAKRCAYTIERRASGLRYVLGRSQCKLKTTHKSGYCHLHRPTEH